MRYRVCFLPAYDMSARVRFARTDVVVFRPQGLAQVVAANRPPAELPLPTTATDVRAVARKRFTTRGILSIIYAGPYSTRAACNNTRVRDLFIFILHTVDYSVSTKVMWLYNTFTERSFDTKTKSVEIPKTYRNAMQWNKTEKQYLF